MNDIDERSLLVIRLVDGINKLLAGQPMDVACTALTTAVTTQVVCLGSNMEEWEMAADNMRRFVGQNLNNADMVAWIQANTTIINDPPEMQQ